VNTGDAVGDFKCLRVRGGSRGLLPKANEAQLGRRKVVRTRSKLGEKEFLLSAASTETKTDEEKKNIAGRKQPGKRGNPNNVSERKTASTGTWADSPKVKGQISC